MNILRLISFAVAVGPYVLVCEGQIVYDVCFVNQKYPEQRLD